MTVQRSSRRRLAALGALVLASVFCLALIPLRYELSGHHVHFANLPWDLVLAWAPFVFALIAYDGHRRGARGISVALPLALWLIFLPNAPYLVTELTMLRQVRDMPIWFDVATLNTAFAWVGLLLGFVSVYLVQDMARRALGPVFGWCCAVGSFALCGIGIYLGRYLRPNSWDVVFSSARRRGSGRVAPRVAAPDRDEPAHRDLPHRGLRDALHGARSRGRRAALRPLPAAADTTGRVAGSRRSSPPSKAWSGSVPPMVALRPCTSSRC